MHTCIPVCVHFYKSRFPSWIVAVVVNGGSCSSLQSTGSCFFFFFLTLSFRLSIFSKLWWYLWPVSAPSVILGFPGSAWLGSGPLSGPLTPGSEGFQTWSWLMGDSLFFSFFFIHGKACKPLSPHRWGRVWGQRLPSAPLDSVLVQCSKHIEMYSSFILEKTGGKKHLRVICFRKWMRRLCFIQHLSKTPLGIINLGPDEVKTLSKRFCTVCFSSGECCFSNTIRSHRVEC